MFSFCFEASRSAKSYKYKKKSTQNQTERLYVIISQVSFSFHFSFCLSLSVSLSQEYSSLPLTGCGFKMCVFFGLKWSAVLRDEMGREPGGLHSLFLSLWMVAILPELLDCSSTCLRECIFLCLPVQLPVNHHFQMRTKCCWCQCNLTTSSRTTNPRSSRIIFFWILWAHKFDNKDDLTCFLTGILLNANCESCLVV